MRLYMKEVQNQVFLVSRNSELGRKRGVPDYIQAANLLEK
jgi:hypothetical protein